MDLFGCHLSGQSENVREAVNSFFENAFVFAQSILNEDMEIAEIQQRGIESACHQGRLSEDESLVLFLQNVWRNSPLFSQRPA